MHRHAGKRGRGDGGGWEGLLGGGVGSLWSRRGSCCMSFTSLSNNMCGDGVCVQGGGGGCRVLRDRSYVTYCPCRLRRAVDLPARTLED